MPLSRIWEMSETTGLVFDFEAWATLAREHPEEFERRPGQGAKPPEEHSTWAGRY